MNTQEFFVPGPLPGLNDILGASNANRHIYNGMKKKWQKLVVIAAMEQQLNPVGETPVKFTFYWHEKHRRRDLDNVAAAKKFVLDGLVQGGFIKDDNWKQVRGFQDIFTVNKDRPGVVVVMEETDD